MFNFVKYTFAEVKTNSNLRKPQIKAYIDKHIS